MLCTHRDYYITETFLIDKYPDKLDPKTEKRGAEGINKYTYWATNDLLKDWIELPLITPK